MEKTPSDGAKSHSHSATLSTSRDDSVGLKTPYYLYALFGIGSYSLDLPVRPGGEYHQNVDVAPFYCEFPRPPPPLYIIYTRSRRWGNR